MTIVLIFVILYLIASAWDVAHVNGLFDKMVNPGSSKRATPMEPAPRLVINLPATSKNAVL